MTAVEVQCTDLPPGQLWSLYSVQLLLCLFSSVSCSQWVVEGPRHPHRIAEVICQNPSARHCLNTEKYKNYTTNYSPHTSQCILQCIRHSAVQTIQYIMSLYAPPPKKNNYLLHTIKSTIFTAHYSLHTIHYTMNTIHCTLIIRGCSQIMSD